ncbi:Aspartyl/glutamyl-tRNA (Asn/Gln) amidotransferase subunit B [Gossypium arboreum]|uniref:Aspartyl/glutamyl-tRNA (Asn/Gln) amidotransferase subunit B n=1 Tax=Gossypium arboreum TaxID=29729 RepID=A0A0B0N1P3_GOSAR|nr:Aspartyl/glutamyl-tRNA (Asn/Gln) amidotransferase subunit B [Gossypium arboreum]
MEPAEYKFPDPIPEFADAETDKFRSHLLNKLSKKDFYGDSFEEVVGICTEVVLFLFSNNIFFLFSWLVGRAYDCCLSGY